LDQPFLGWLRGGENFFKTTRLVFNQKSFNSTLLNGLSVSFVHSSYSEKQTGKIRVLSFLDIDF
jgi:hypothetical protein